MVLVSCDGEAQEPTVDEDIYVPLTLEFPDDGQMTGTATITFTSEAPVELFYLRSGYDKQSKPVENMKITGIKAGDIIRIYANRTTQDELNIQCSEKCFVYGNVMSLIQRDGFWELTEVYKNAFKKLFYGNENIKEHYSKVLVLPATTLAEGCYYQMFAGCDGLNNLSISLKIYADKMAVSSCCLMFHNCKSLKYPPKLPATTMANNCYQEMFEGCSMLIAVPDLPATTLADECYLAMFCFCTRLVNASIKLPANTTCNRCYGSMFYNCDSLVNGPLILAESLADYCCDSMFGVSDGHSSKLRSLTCLATNFGVNPTQSWVVATTAESGTLYVPESMINHWPKSISGVPSNWTVEEYIE